MRLRDQLVQQPRRRPAPAPQEAHGVREVSYLADGNYPRAQVRQIVSQLRDGIPDAGATVDELGIGLCGLLEGGRFAHCEADRCYPSREAMRVKAFSTHAHGNEPRETNPFPEGCAQTVDVYQGDGQRITKQIQSALDYAAMARQQFEASQQPQPDPRAAEALSKLAAVVRDQDALRQMENERQLAELQEQQAALAAEVAARTGGG